MEATIEGFMDDTEVTEKFADQMLQSIVPRDAGDKIFAVYQGVMDAVLTDENKDRKREILISLAMEWLKIRLEAKGEPLDPEDVAARLATVFLQANGFMGVKLGQILSDSTAIQLSDKFRKAFGRLKSRVRPFDKATALRLLDEALPGGFKAHYKRIIGLPVGSASLKVTFLVEDLDGNYRLIKIKRPEVVVALEEDMEYLSRCLKYIKPFLDLYGIELPDDLVEKVRKELLDEMNFDKEKADQELLGEVLSARQVKKGVFIRVPIGYKVYNNFIFEEEFVAGSLLQNRDELQKKGINIARIRRVLKYELLTQLFIDGIFHMDPHAGNIIVVDNNEIVFIDNSIGRIRQELRIPLLALLMQIHPWRFVRSTADRWLDISLEEALGALVRPENRPTHAELKAIADELRAKLSDESLGDNISKRFLNIIFFLEKKGLILNEDLEAVRKFFSAADYLISNIGARDILFIRKLIRQMKRAKKGTKNAGMPPLSMAPPLDSRKIYTLLDAAA